MKDDIIVTDNEEAHQQQPCMLMIGGCKGHIIESIHGDILHLYQYYHWKMIPNCTGRYTCRDHKIVNNLRPTELLQNAGIFVDDSINNIKEYSFSLPNLNDPIIVVPLDNINETGIITYVKRHEEFQSQQKLNSDITNSCTDDDDDDNKINHKTPTTTTKSTTTTKPRYIHTLNTKSGFRRKLNAIGIYVDDHQITSTL